MTSGLTSTVMDESSFLCFSNTRSAGTAAPVRPLLPASAGGGMGASGASGAAAAVHDVLSNTNGSYIESVSTELTSGEAGTPSIPLGTAVKNEIVEQRDIDGTSANSNTLRNAPLVPIGPILECITWDERPTEGSSTLTKDNSEEVGPMTSSAP